VNEILDRNICSKTQGVAANDSIKDDSQINHCSAALSAKRTIVVAVATNAIICKKKTVRGASKKSGDTDQRRGRGNILQQDNLLQRMISP